MNDVEIVQLMPVQVVLVHCRMKFPVEHPAYFRFYDFGRPWRQIVVYFRILTDTPLREYDSQITVIYGRLVLMTPRHQRPYHMVQVRIVRNTERFIRTVVVLSTQIFSQVRCN